MSYSMGNEKMVYHELEKETDKIFNELVNLNDDDKNISGIKEAILKFANIAKQKIFIENKSLQENSEWDTFTIAFYGETNAGKSTIIEVLRILLQEKTKIEEMNKFKEFQESNKCSEHDIEEINVSLSACMDTMNHLTEEKERLSDELARKENEINIKIENLQNIIKNKKKELSIFNKLLYIIKLKRFEEEAEYKFLKKLSVSNKKLVDTIAKDISLKTREFDCISHKKEEMLKKLKEIIEYEDGKIIGDGRSDFTKENHKYHFEYKGQEFDLIDVPGIEGDEEKVKEVIWQAVKKAHAVFYVTNKAARPQTGNELKKGTLEKIKEHLGRQTEVWTIFNKSVTNPIQLSEQILNDDEQKSIDDLDVAMKKLFNDKYCGTICLSALPAFLSASKCLSTYSPRYAQREKFIKKFTESEILNFSNINFLIEKLMYIVRDFPEKIRRANFFKASCLLNDITTDISILINDKIEPAHKKLEYDIDNTIKQIDISLEKVEKVMKKNAYNAIREFIDNVSEKTYKYIDGNVSNKEFKSKFKEYLENDQEELLTDIESAIRDDVDKFSSDIKNIITRLQERLKEFSIITKEKHIDNFTDFDLDIDIKLNIDVASIVGTLISIGVAISATFASGGLALPVLILSIATAILSAGKTVWGMVNSNYKKAQQRKTTDEQLEKIEIEAKNCVDTYITDNIMPDINIIMHDIKSEIKVPASQILNIKTLMNKICNNLLNLRSMSNIFEDIAV